MVRCPVRPPRTKLGRRHLRPDGRSHRAGSESPRRRNGRSRRSSGSAARPAGTTQTASGGCAGSSTRSSAGSAFGGGAETRSACGGRHARLLAGRSFRAGSASAARCRDEDARTHLAAVRGRCDAGGATLCQTAIFDPHGLAGLAYWYALYPVHYLIFAGMLRRVARAAEHRSESRASLPPGALGGFAGGASRRTERS